MISYEELGHVYQHVSNMEHRLLYNTDGKAADQRTKKERPVFDFTLTQPMPIIVTNST